MTELKEPEGIAFFNVKNGDTHFCKLEPTISAYINSSDMGINASRGQDFGWKLGKEWVKRVREFRRNRLGMQMLSTDLGGKKPTTVQILYYLYSEDLRAYSEEVDENENPFEEQYQQDISERKRPAPKADDDEDVSDLVDDEDLEPGEAPEEPVKPTPSPAPKVADTTVKVKNGQMTVPKTDGKTSTAKQK